MNDTLPTEHVSKKPEAKQKSPSLLAKLLAGSFFAGVLGLIAGAAFILYLSAHPFMMKAEQTIIIPRGSSVQDIAEILDQKQAVPSPLLFRLMARFFAPNGLQAGEFRLRPDQSAIDVLMTLRDGKPIVRKLTFAEGLTTAEILDLLANEPALSGDVTLNPEEGALLPETYHFTYGDSRNGIIERMQKAAESKLAELWKSRSADLPYKSASEALVMASIVEKETGKKAEERARVAGVFLNRLKVGMRLQSDPTVIYGLTDGKKALGRDLTHQDLETASAYNTYTIAGLPQKPICNPGLAALNAALHPEKNDFYYFVADGSGGHAFAKDLAEHNKNVSAWHKINQRD